MSSEELGIVEIQQWRHVRRPVVRTASGVYLLDHPQWLAQAGRTIKVRISRGEQFAEVIEKRPADFKHDSQGGKSGPTSESPAHNDRHGNDLLRQCPICSGQLQATLEDYASDVVLTREGTLVSYEDAGCGDVRIYRENDHTLDEIQRKLAGD